MIVSHDREFLARTVTRVVELDLAQQQVGVYDGGYDSYLAEREEIAALLFNVSDMVELLRELVFLAGGDDGGEEEDAD